MVEDGGMGEGEEDKKAKKKKKTPNPASVGSFRSVSTVMRWNM